MALIDKVKDICDRLADQGWGALMQHHGLQMSQPTADLLASELNKTFQVDRTVPGFEDFITGSAKGVDQGNPAGSILYHAMASPNVGIVPNQGSLLAFPTLKEIDTIENYIFGVEVTTLESLQQHARDLLDLSVDAVPELAVTVFAAEYRPAPETPHRKFADLCFSRTGVARVGTMAPHYDAEARGFMVSIPGEANHVIHALPARYVPYIAVKAKGRRNRFGPMRFRVAGSNSVGADSELDFWVPLHKLFSGPECLEGMTLDVELVHRHVNEKLARLQGQLRKLGHSDRSDVELAQPPFTFSSGIAHWADAEEFGPGVLAPDPHRLVEPAVINDQLLTYRIPALSSEGLSGSFSPTLTLKAPAPPVRPYPEYSHVRHEIRNGQLVDKNRLPNVDDVVKEGGYDALHYIDFTGDGWIGAVVGGPLNLPSVRAYSLVTAPDFFPNVDQREVYEWWQGKMQPDIQATLPPWESALVDDDSWQTIWRGGAEPESLSDHRYPPNRNLPEAPFDDDEPTTSSIVTLLQRIDLDQENQEAPATRRHAHLPDAAAGVFAPGWDVSGDWAIPNNRDTIHLAAYGLGSPFPEDAKLCAALSTFWPAAAPDTTRTFFEVPFSEGTVCPMTDAELGVGEDGVAWDGVIGPRIVQVDGQFSVVEYSSYDHADYTQNALDNSFSIALTSRVGIREYQQRILAMQRSYRALGIMSDAQKDTLHLLSFRRLEFDDPELQEAQQRGNASLNGPVFRFEFFQNRVRLSDSVVEDNWTQLQTGNQAVDKDRYQVRFTWRLLVGAGRFLLARWQQGDGSLAGGNWQRVDV